MIFQNSQISSGQDEGSLHEISIISSHILDVNKIYHHALRREEDEAKNIGGDLEAINVSLESIEKDLQDSKLHIYEIQKYLNAPHLSSCMEGNVLGTMEESHVDS